MSLREEIYQYISTLLIHYDNYGINRDKEANVYTWELVTKIEKRIDELKTKHPKDLYGAYNAGLDDVMGMLK